jgi:hypothetical protein
MAFRVSNAIIVAGTSIDSATKRSLPLGHAPSPRGPSGSAFQYNVQPMFRFSAILDRRHQELYIYIPLIAASADETALRWGHSYSISIGPPAHTLVIASSSSSNVTLFS